MYTYWVYMWYVFYWILVRFLWGSSKEYWWICSSEIVHDKYALSMFWHKWGAMKFINLILNNYLNYYEWLRLLHSICIKILSNCHIHRFLCFRVFILYHNQYLYPYWYNLDWRYEYKIQGSSVKLMVHWIVSISLNISQSYNITWCIYFWYNHHLGLFIWWGRQWRNFL